MLATRGLVWAVRRLETVLLIHVGHDLSQGHVLRNKEIKDLVLMPSPIQGFPAIVAILLHAV